MFSWQSNNHGNLMQGNNNSIMIIMKTFRIKSRRRLSLSRSLTTTSSYSNYLYYLSGINATVHLDCTVKSHTQDIIPFQYLLNLHWWQWYKCDNSYLSRTKGRVINPTWEYEATVLPLEMFAKWHILIHTSHLISNGSFVINKTPAQLYRMTPS